jgi:alkaline phosphatase D
VSNPLIIGGDVHAHHVANVKLNFDRPDTRIVATEFCGTSITSEGDTSDLIAAGLAANPHMLLSDARRRGYVVMDLGRKEARASLRVIDNEKLKRSSLDTLASFVVQAGRPGAEKA